MDRGDTSLGDRAPGLGTWQRWLIGGVLGVAVAVAASAVLGLFSDDSNDTDSNVGDTQEVTPGEEVDPAALWLFGFDTVRLDPETLTGGQSLGYPAFGTPYAVDDEIYLYEPADGRFGVLKASTNEFTELDSLPVAPFDSSDTTMAATDEALAIVTGPNEVTLVDRNSPDQRSTIESTDETRDVVGTWIAADEATLFALREYRDGSLAVARMSEEGDDVSAVEIAPADAATLGDVRAFTADSDRLWIAGSNAVVPFDTQDLKPGEVIPVSAATGEVHRAAAADGALWALVGTGDVVARIGIGDDFVGLSVREPNADRYREPTSLIAGRDRVWVLVPSSDEPDSRASALTEIDPITVEPVRRLDISSDLFAGAIAVT